MSTVPNPPARLSLPLSLPLWRFTLIGTFLTLTTFARPTPAQAGPGWVRFRNEAFSSTNHTWPSCDFTLPPEPGRLVVDTAKWRFNQAVVGPPALPLWPGQDMVYVGIHHRILSWSAGISEAVLVTGGALFPGTDYRDLPNNSAPLVIHPFLYYETGSYKHTTYSRALSTGSGIFRVAFGLSPLSACRAWQDVNTSCADPPGEPPAGCVPPPKEPLWEWRMIWWTGGGISDVQYEELASAPQHGRKVPQPGSQIPLVIQSSIDYYAPELTDSPTAVDVAIVDAGTQYYTPPHQPAFPGDDSPHENWPSRHRREWTADTKEITTESRGLRLYADESMEGWNICQGVVPGTPCSTDLIAGKYIFGSSDCEGTSQKDPVNLVFFGETAQSGPVVQHAINHLQWSDPSNVTSMYFSIEGQCQQMDGELASASCVNCARDHSRFRDGADIGGIVQQFSVGGVHREVGCRSGVGHRVTDFDAIRDTFAAAFTSAGHGHVSIADDFWGNTEASPQCDGSPMGMALAATA